MESHNGWQARGQQTTCRVFGRMLALLGALTLAMLMVGAVLALNSVQAFHAAGEQIIQGEGVSGTYSSTHATDGAYRVVEETYVGDVARTAADTPSSFPYSNIHPGTVIFTPYTMPAEGGYIHRIDVYVGTAGTTQLRVALYTDWAREPRLLLAESEPLTVTGIGWLSFPIAPQRLAGGTRYWIAYQADNNQAQLIWRLLTGEEPADDEYRTMTGWSWGAFPELVTNLTFSGGTGQRACYGIAYTATQYALTAVYTVPVEPNLDAYTLTLRGGTSGETFTVWADGEAAGMITYTPTSRYVFSDSLEDGSGNWTAHDFSLVVTDSTHYSSATHAWWTTWIANNHTTTLTSPVILLPFSAHNLELRFWHTMDTEPQWDGGQIDYRVRAQSGTWSEWTMITRTQFLQGGYNRTLCTTLPCESNPQLAWSGLISPGIVSRILLPEAAVGHEIQFRWRFRTDQYGNGALPEGYTDSWWIDDVQVVGTVGMDNDIVFSLPVTMTNDSEVLIQFRDTITNSFPDRLGLDGIEIAGMLYNRAPGVTVTVPNGGEYWRATRTITWTGSDRNGDLVTYDLYASTDNGLSWSPSLYQVSYTETQTAATHSWTGFDTTAFSDSDQVLIRIQASDGMTTASDLSDAIFHIDNTTPTVALTAPNGGEILLGGSVYTITWTATDAHFGAQPIALHYSTDGGATYPYTITAATENDGTYLWSVPALESTTVRVRVTAIDLAGNSALDTSASDLSIDNTAPTVTLTAPNGGEVLPGGGVYTITWTATDAHFGVTPIALHYSTDGGLTYPNVITTATENDGTYLWSVPAVETSTVRVRVTATDLVGHAGTDISNANFSLDSTAPAVILTAPNGGEILLGGGTYTITWTATDAHFSAQPIALHYSTDGGLTYPYTITTATENDGTYLWSVPALESTTVRVRVTATDVVGHATPDASDANFSLDSTAPVVTLTAPNGGEVLLGGGVYTITWTATDAHFGAQPIALHYSTDGGATYPYTITTATENDGTYLWSVPALESTTVRVRVTAIDLAGNSALDTSASDLSIDNTAPTVTLTAPNGGEVLPGGGVYTITWTATDAHFGAQPIALHYSTDGGLTYPNVITTATENDGTYLWSVPAVETSTVRVRVTATDAVGHATLDASDANFSIDSTAPVVTLTAPNGGEILLGGGVYTITWTATDAHFSAQPIALHYSTDGGLTYLYTITTATENDGTYLWSVPALESTTVRVRVTATDLVGHTGTDISNANFSLDNTAPAVILTAPNGGEVLRGGGTYTITWTATDAHFGVTPIALHYSTDGGLTYPYTITTATENDGTYLWSVPALESTTVRVRVTATDLVGHAGTDISDANFSLDSTAPAVILTAPNGGEILLGGGVYTITWTATDAHFGTQPIALHYSTDGGATYPNVITTATENDGSYLWNVPAVESTQVLVRIIATDLGGNASTDTSNANLSIDATAPTVTLTAPNGGELLLGSGTFTITWTATDAHFGAQPIALAYSTDGGATYPNVITTATENDGSYLWSVPALESTTVRVRVTATDAVGHATPDASDANFSLDSTAPVVTLTAPNGGEVLLGGGVYTITWTATDAHFGAQPIALHYSTDGGATYPYTITTATENDGTYLWSVPQVDSDQVCVRVTAIDIVGHATADASDANFSIDSTAPVVTLTAPDGGEILLGSGVYTITWTATDAHLGTTPIALFYSTNDGVTYAYTITTATENDGSYLWDVPALDNMHLRIQVRVTDLAGNSASDASNGSFIVDSTAPSGTVAIAEGDYVRLAAIHLQLTAPDDTVAVYVDGDLQDGDTVRQWVPFTTTLPVTLTASEGLKTVQVHFRDLASNVGPDSDDTTLYDTTLPSVTNPVPTPDSTVMTSTPLIQAKVADGGSGILSTTLRLWVDGMEVTPAYDPATGTVTYTPPTALSNLTHTVQLTIQDRAGNEGLLTWSFAVNEPPAMLVAGAQPSALVADGVSTATITATVHSASGYEVADGTTVVFTTTLGTFETGTVYTTTTQAGVAIAVLRAPVTDGTAHITIQAGNASGALDVKFYRFRIYLPLTLRARTP